MRILRISFAVAFAALGVALVLSALSPGPPELELVETGRLGPSGSWMAPVPSPDGRYLAFTGDSFKGVHLLDLASGAVTQVSDLAGAGFRPAWSRDSRSLAFRATLTTAPGRHVIVVAHPDGVNEVASPISDSVSLPFWRDLQVWYARTDGGRPGLRRAGPAPERDRDALPMPVAMPDGRLVLTTASEKSAEVAAPSGRPLFLPVVSADGARFVAECLDGHLYLGATSGGPLKDVGAGSWASFVRGDSALLFERTSDDGHAVTASELILLDLETFEARPIRQKAALMPRRPAMAADGHALYFDAEGALYKGWLP